MIDEEKARIGFSVLYARLEGKTWMQAASDLGITRQVARHRHALARRFSLHPRFKKAEWLEDDPVDLLNEAREKLSRMNIGEHGDG